MVSNGGVPPSERSTAASVAFSQSDRLRRRSFSSLAPSDLGSLYKQGADDDGRSQYSAVQSQGGVTEF